MLKGVLVLIDGLGDGPCKQLEEKSPLEAANIPNMNFLAARGELGYLYPISPGFVPESDEAILSIFGNKEMSNFRGVLEAKGAGVKLKRGDLAIRANFATINPRNRKVIDRRAGRNLTTEEAEILSKALNKIELPCEFEFIPTVQHRAVLILRGGFSEDISGNDEPYIRGRAVMRETVGRCEAYDDEDNTHYTANILNEFLEKAGAVLREHPVNKERVRKGWLPANFLLVRSPGIEYPKLKQYKNWYSLCYMPLEKGFAELSGMDNFSFEYPKFKGIDAYKNLYDGLGIACKMGIKVIKKAMKKADYVYIHLNETDFPGHDNKPVEKKYMIEYIDATLIRYLRKIAPGNKIKVIVTGNYSAPCRAKGHTSDPVPVLFYNNGEIPKEKNFSEKECRLGGFGRVVGKELLEKAGFVK